jgi:hypothetical protein
VLCVCRKAPGVGHPLYKATTTTTMDGRQSSGAVAPEGEAVASSALSINLDELVDYDLDSSASTIKRRVDESFLSYRPGTMDEYHDRSYCSVMSTGDPNNGSVEVYDRHQSETNDRNNRSGLLSSSTYVNVHNSILDDTLDEDELKSVMEDEEGDDAFEGASVPYFPSTPQKRRQRAVTVPPHSTDTPPPTPRRCISGGSASRELACGGTASSSLIDLTDRLVGMCFGGTVGTATPVPAPGTPGGSRIHRIPSSPRSYKYPTLDRSASGGSTNTGGAGKGHRSNTSCVIDALHLVQEDMFQFLGCSDESVHTDAAGHELDPRHQPHWSDQSLFCFRGRREASALLTNSSSNDSDRQSGTSRPSRLSFRERAERVRRYRAERVMPHKRTGLTLLPGVQFDGQSQPHPYRKSRSLVDEPTRGSRTRRRAQPGVQGGGHGRRKSDDRMEGGYDSDPEVNWGESAPPVAIPMYPLIESPQLIPEDEEEDGSDSASRGAAGPARAHGDYSPTDTDRIVQESLNLSWTLTWHPPTAKGSPSQGSTSTTADADGGISPPAPASSSSSPVVITAWIERGTLINGNTVMLEPCFMWRQAYQPDVEESRRLRHRHNKQQQRQHKSGAAAVSPSPLLPTPHSLKLLNVARILPGVVVAADGDPGHRPLAAARDSCSLTVHTVSGESIVVEAASRAERNALLKRWKVVVARFVTLAILEQFEVMADEFFTPRTALPNY